MSKVVPALLAIVLAAGRSPAQSEPRFARDVRPILAGKCFFCHGFDAGERQARLRLDTRDGATAARRGGAAIVPGNARRSLLVQRIRERDPERRMPPPESHKTLSDAEIDVLTRWIDAGASYERHWAYVLPRRAPPPEVADAAWPHNDIDRWILARLERDGLAPSPEADRVTLLRRVSFDLTGLPPSPAGVDAFVRDESPGAFARVVDRLLASEAHAERLASWWLDLVRYADTVGYHGDQEHRISPYRDWVLRAFRDNMPFDRFTELQLAGDLQQDPTGADRVASGYNRLLQTTHEGGAQAEEYLAIYAADRVRNFGAVWLAQTTGCAQCHDHKYDPIRTKDFYQLAAFFADIEEVGDFKGSPDTSPTTRPPELLLIDDAGRQELARLDAALEARRRAAGKGWRKDPEYRQVQARREAVAARGRYTMITKARKTPRVVRVLPRGDWLDDSGDVVAPRAPAYLPRIDVQGRRATRRDLARWLFRPDHPLTARVVVNRLWALFFGRGLSRTLEDLGAQGQWPTHPELLDTLAVELRRNGWDLRRLIREIVMSRAYRQASMPRRELAVLDPENRLLARQSRWRVPAEAVRDTALAVSGLLVQRFGGDSARPYQPAGYYRHLNFPPRRYVPSRDDGQWRRGLYMHWQRQFLHPMLKAFDAPTREECCAERPRSNTPQAALVLLNDPTFVEAARALAARLAGGDAVMDDAVRLRRGFRLATSRAPSAAELATLARLLARHRTEYARDPGAARALLSVGLSPRPGAEAAGGRVAELAAWTSVARVLLNLSETYTRS